MRAEEQRDPSMPTNSDRQGVRFGLLFWIALAMAGIFVAFDLAANRHYYSDIDDVLRGEQIRQLLARGGWFDLTIAGIDMPGSYLSPWSRLVDLPYVALTLILRTVTSDTNAVLWAFRLWPPVMMIGFCGLWLLTARQANGPYCRLEPVHVVAAFAMMPLTLWEFSPGRIDHHNVQIVLLLAALYGISKWSVVGGFIAGVASGLSFAVGLELAPAILLLLLAPGLAWIARVEGSRNVQLSLSAGLAASTLATGLLLVGPARVITVECDAFSAPFAVALLGYSVLTFGVVAFGWSGRPGARFGAMALVALLLMGVVALAYPACLHGPYAIVDPLVRALWLDRVQQEQSFIEFYRMGDTIKIVCLGLLLVVASAALPIFLRHLRRRDAGFVIVFSIAIFLLLLAFFQTRFIRFPAACVLLFLPVVWQEIKYGVRATTTALIGGAAVTLVVGGVIFKLVPSVTLKPVLLDYVAFDLCTKVDASPLAGLPPGRIIAPSSLGLFLLDRLPVGMTINAISFHRAAPGMRRMFDVFVSTDSETRKLAAAPFDYLAICRYPMVEEIPNDTLFAVLTRGGNWPGLIRITDPQRELQLFKIDHAQFR